MPVDVLQARFRVPPLRAEWLARPRLIRQLDGGLGARLTLLSAPAGFGKTTLLGEWLRRLDRPFAWVSLDKDDNAWPRFLAACLTSLQSLDPAFGTGLLGALEAPPLPSFDRVLGILPGELAGLRRSFVLVLDDFHVLVDPLVHDLLTYLIDNQPPGMHLVLAGRADPPWPLARLRAAGALNEVRAADLRFTHEETGALLNDTIGLDLSSEDLSTLEVRTEGWVAGLHLAALSLRRAADRHAFIQAFAGSDRFVLDYLMEEVLAQQPPEVRTFLLQTSLFDRFNAALCDHVTGRTDSQERLRHLESANLFVIPLDNDRQWFAYHALMRSFLRSVQEQRDPDGASALHLRAMAWYEANGDVLDAIQHGMRAGAHEQIGRLIRSNGLALVFQGELSTVLSWLHDSRETWPRTGPWLRIAQLWGHFFSGDESTVAQELAETRAVVEEGVRAFQDEPNPARVTELNEALAHLKAIEANLAVMDGRHAEAVQLAREAVYGLPASDSTTRRYSYVVLGMALRQLGELAPAVDALTQADAPSGDLRQVPAPARGLATLAGVQIWMGQLEEAEATCRRLIALHDEYLRRCGRRLPIAAFGYARLSEIMRQRNRLDEALRLAQESRALAERWQQMDALFESYTHFARALHAIGDTPAALAALHKQEQTVRGRSPWLHGLTLIEEARLCLSHAQDAACLARARAWAEAHPLPADGQLIFRDHDQYLMHAQLLLYEARTDRNRARAGLDLVGKLLRLLAPTGAQGLRLEASLVCALLEAALGESEAALDRVAACLREAEPRGYVRMFLDQGQAMQALLARVPASDRSHAYAQALLRASAASPPAAAMVSSRSLPAIEEPLSERELEVLRLLSSTLSSAEIADELCVATSTVRSHTKAIYGKLGVHTRLEAIDKARDLALI
jgi:LuxR family maltose regulon positive regulatory protein